MSEPRTAIAAGAVVVDAEGRVLLVRRARPPSAGTWTLPGGRVEAGETPEAAVVREVLEETGLAVRVECEICKVHIAREGYSFLVHEFLAVPDSATARASIRAGDDADDARWVSREELTGLEVLPDAVEVIDRGLTEAFARSLATRKKHGS